MKVSLQQFKNDQWVKHTVSKQVDDNKVQLVLCFSDKESLVKKKIFNKLKTQFPKAEIVLCSTAGEIYQNVVQDNSQVAVAFEFGDTKIKTASVCIKDFENSYDAAVHLSNQITKGDLAYILVISDGSLVNGSELVKGFSGVKKQVLVTGGLAGDAANFKSTLVGLNEQPTEGKIVAIGFYGKKIFVTHGSQGGWDMFGLEKEITKSTGNILYEINNQNALDLYKNYLGDEADNLPGAALLFPLSVTIPGSDNPVVRTILSIDENRKSMTFAGDVPVGSRVRFMKANFDKLTMAAATAANNTIKESVMKPDFSLLISCVGRKLVLGHRIDEEVEAVTGALGNSVPVSGFYSYGEISPFNEGGSCQLHNQTMTITSFYELP